MWWCWAVRGWRGNEQYSNVILSVVSLQCTEKWQSMFSKSHTPTQKLPKPDWINTQACWAVTAVTALCFSFSKGENAAAPTESSTKWDMTQQASRSQRYVHYILDVIQLDLFLVMPSVSQISTITLVSTRLLKYNWQSSGWSLKETQIVRNLSFPVRSWEALRVDQLRSNPQTHTEDLSGWMSEQWFSILGNGLVFFKLRECESDML